MSCCVATNQVLDVAAIKAAVKAIAPKLMRKHGPRHAALHPRAKKRKFNGKAAAPVIKKGKRCGLACGCVMGSLRAVMATKDATTFLDAMTDDLARAMGA